MRARRLGLLATVLAGGAMPLAAQSLERKVNAASDGAVQFSYAAREGVCGDGRTYLRTDDDNSWYGSFNGDNVRSQPCTPGPVRVVLVRAGRETVKIESYAGPLFADPAAGQDLGRVPAREASDYLLSLARTLDGRPSRDAILPIMLADSSVVTPQLLAIAKDQQRSRELRRTAISWLARRRNEPNGAGVGAVEKALDQIVRDRQESEPIRQAALSTMSRFDRGEGIPAMLKMAYDEDTWLAKQAFANLARSGDPRARAFVRTSVKRTDLADESKLEAIRALGNEFATSSDVRALRELYPSVNTDRERDQILSTVAQAGGSENANWLLAIAKSPTEPTARRRRVVNQLGKFDDPKIREALKGLIER